MAVPEASVRPVLSRAAMLLSALVACAVLARPCAAQMLEQGSSESSRVVGPLFGLPAEPAPPPPVLTLTVRPKARKPNPDVAPPQAYCVRLCDGFYFPLSSAGDSASGEANLCTAMCPDTPTELYRRAGGEATMDEATGPNRKPYKSLATAYAYRTSLSPQCSCRAAAGLSALALTHDASLRSGDIVVTSKGVRVFGGSSKFPFRDSDFVDFRAPGRVPRSLLTYLNVIDKPFRFTPAAPVRQPGRVSTADEVLQPLVKSR
jgi:uncharacterized protein DUF2865